MIKGRTTERGGRAARSPGTQAREGCRTLCLDRKCSQCWNLVPDWDWVVGVECSQTRCLCGQELETHRTECEALGHPAASSPGAGLQILRKTQPHWPHSLLHFDLLLSGHCSLLHFDLSLHSGVY